MSRIGKMPIQVPDGVRVTVEGGNVTVTGPKGTLTYVLPAGISADLVEGSLLVRRKGEDGDLRAKHGLARSLLANMVRGAASGYERVLELYGTGYRAAKVGNKVVLQVGFSHPVEVEAPVGVELEVPAPNQITVRGADKQLVGQVAADIRAIRPPEPYLGKGIRYAGERVRRKAGKAGKK